MSVKQRTNPQSLGTNRRQQYASNHYDDRIRTEEQLEAAMDLLIQQAHCRLLERATGGVLTWLGDTIVPGPAGRRVRVKQVVVTAQEFMHKEVEAWQDLQPRHVSFQRKLESANSHQSLIAR